MPRRISAQARTLAAALLVCRQSLIVETLPVDLRSLDYNKRRLTCEGDHLRLVPLFDRGFFMLDSSIWHNRIFPHFRTLDNMVL